MPDPFDNARLQAKLDRYYQPHADTERLMDSEFKKAKKKRRRREPSKWDKRAGKEKANGQ